jgi:hypothetical protein
MEVLAFERTEWPTDVSRFGVRSQGRKEAAVLERFGFRLTRYYQLLNRIIDDPAAMAYDPQLVARLRRIRDHKADLRRTPRSAS